MTPNRQVGKVASVIVAVILSVLMLAAGYDTSDDYTARISEKQRRLASLASPKIVIIGGSNAAFGIDSQLLQTQSGRPVVNMGLWADVGLPFMLSQVLPFVRPGDLAIITPEYEVFFKDALSAQARYRAASFLPQPWIVLSSPLDAARFVIATIVERAQGTVQTTIRKLSGRVVREPIYSRRSFNELGDVVAHLGSGPRLDTMEATRSAIASRALDTAVFSTLRTFALQARASGANVVLIPPAILDIRYRHDKPTIDRLYGSWLRASSDGGFEVLGTPAEFAFPLEDMFDTMYHLNGRGRQLRMKRILELLIKAGLLHDNSFAPSRMGA